MTPFNYPRQNRMLHSLPPADWARIQPQLQLVAMPAGHVLYESGMKMPFAFFPTTCIVSILNATEDGHCTETAIVGNEGVVGVSLFMGGNTTPSRGVVQSAGEGYALRAGPMQAEFQRAGSLQQLLLRYVQALITQMAQTAACNRRHSVDQQLCRWLLQSLDRLATNDLIMTQELISNILGVRREGITESAGKLQRLGLISYRRGHITVVDRPALEQQACECYAVVKKEFDRLLPRLLPPVAAPQPVRRYAGQWAARELMAASD